ncbi:MAG: HAMP domain-containing sensor histidine kinase [Oscillospiraceae bacterium]
MAGRQKVDVGLTANAAGVHVGVRDYGRDIPEGELPHVKEKFYKGNCKNHGTGIGLAVCDEIITRHSGQLEIENAEGGGCIAKIILPIVTKEKAWQIIRARSTPGWEDRRS